MPAEVQSCLHVPFSQVKGIPKAAQSLLEQSNGVDAATGELKTDIAGVEVELKRGSGGLAMAGNAISSLKSEGEELALSKVKLEHSPEDDRAEIPPVSTLTARTDECGNGSQQARQAWSDGSLVVPGKSEIIPNVKVREEGVPAKLEVVESTILDKDPKLEIKRQGGKAPIKISILDRETGGCPADASFRAESTEDTVQSGRGRGEDPDVPELPSVPHAASTGRQPEPPANSEVGAPIGRVKADVLEAVQEVTPEEVADVEGGRRGPGRRLREVVNKFSRDRKSTREVLFLQQQFYQEDSTRGDVHSQDSNDGPGQEEGEQEDGGGGGRATDEPTVVTPGTGKLPWRFHSPCGKYGDNFYRRSPNFRRTPGASRPLSTRLYNNGYHDGGATGGNMAGGYPGHHHLANRGGGPNAGGGGDGGMGTSGGSGAGGFWTGAGSRSFFQSGPPPTKMLYASDLCGSYSGGGGGGGGGGRPHTAGAARKDGRDSDGDARCSSPQQPPPPPPPPPRHQGANAPPPPPSSTSSAAGVMAAAGGPVIGGTAVQVMVSNLDYNISAREWKKILTAEFQQHVQVLSSYVQTQVDNTTVGYVQVASVDEARYAISLFHRKKIGYKRIHVSLVNSQANSVAANSKSEVAALLREVTDNTLPLFKFIEMFEKRYHRSISVSELHRMRDTIVIEEEDGSGRTVSLLSTPDSPKTDCSHSTDAEQIEELESPVCTVHCKEGSAAYLAALDSACLPNAFLQMKTFSAQVHTLLQSHDGSMPLMSIQSCFECDFGTLTTCVEGGVPLENLISCVPGVKVAITRSGVKKIQWVENKTAGNQEGRSCTSPRMTQQLSQFSREVVDLLKHTPQCRMSFSKFIPSYHHHFGRQCRVADYGYTKLMELFEAIPHVVQIIGSGSRRLVTLSHRTQVKRFTADLLRVLKSQASKQISITDFPIVYNKVVCKPFDIAEYGVCFIEDILCEVPESTVLIQGCGQEMVIQIPRREQTLEEWERTQQFSVEVIDLLRHSPQCRMSFNKFIPAYHHHLGKQCRVADYGFTKLIELFEAIPHVLKIEDEDDDKMLCLTEKELAHVLEDQVIALLRSCVNNELPVPEFLNSFMRFHGHGIRLQDYGVSSVCELIQLIPCTASIETSSGRAIIRLVDHSEQELLACRVLLLLMDHSRDATMTVDNLCAHYQETYDELLAMEQLAQLHGYLDFSGDVASEGSKVKLNTLQMFARDARTVLRANRGRLSLQHFEAAFSQFYGVALVPPAYGYASALALLQAIPHVITVSGKGYRRMLLLTKEFIGDDTGPVTATWRPSDPPADSSETNAQPVSPPTGICTDPTCTTTPSNDSGITECLELSPNEPGASPQPNTNHLIPQRQLSFDPGNIPVPEMFAKYGENMTKVTPGSPCPEIHHMTTQMPPPFSSPPPPPPTPHSQQYGLTTYAYTTDLSLPPPPNPQGSPCQYMPSTPPVSVTVQNTYPPFPLTYGHYASPQGYCLAPPPGPYMTSAPAGAVGYGQPLQKPRAMMTCASPEVLKYGTGCQNPECYSPSAIPPGGLFMMTGSNPSSPIAFTGAPIYPVLQGGLHRAVMPITCESLEASAGVCYTSSEASEVPVQEQQGEQAMMEKGMGNDGGHLSYGNGSKASGTDRKKTVSLSLKKAGAKLKELCLTAPPRLLVPVRPPGGTKVCREDDDDGNDEEEEEDDDEATVETTENSAQVDDNNNTIGVVTDPEEVETGVVTFPKESNTTGGFMLSGENQEQLSKKDGEVLEEKLTSGLQMSPKKNRLAARFFNNEDLDIAAKHNGDM